jgi:hypothetical protein
MNNIIVDLKRKPLSGSEIREATDDEMKILTYKSLSRFKNIDDAFGDKNSIALLYETKPRYGHWVGLYRHPEGVIEFFDPYGFFIDDQLNFMDKEFKHELGGDYPYLSKLLYNSPYEIIYNSDKLQKQKKGISSCGRHVVLRHIASHIPLHEYSKLLKSNVSINNPDELVTYLTAFI